MRGFCHSLGLGFSDVRIKLRDLLGGICFGIAYAIFDAAQYAHAAPVVAFHFMVAVIAGWAFFHTSRVLHRNVTLDPVPLSHPLIRWPAFIVAVCAVFAVMLGNVRPVLMPLALALAVLSGSIGGLLSVWLRRNN